MNKFISFMKEMEVEKLIDEGKFAEAVPILLQSLDKGEFIDRFGLLDKISYCYIKLENFESGLKYLNEMVKINPHSASVKHNLAICHYYLGNYEISARYFEDLTDTEFNDSFSNFHLCVCYIKLAKFDNAEKLYAAFLNDEHAGQTIFNIGMNLVHESQPSRAKDLYLKYLHTYPKDIDCMFGLGISYVETKDYQKSIECFTRVFEWDKDRFPMAPVLLGMSYFEVGQAPKALVYLKHAIEQDASNYEAWYYTGIVYDALNQPDNSIEALRQAAGLKPHSSEIWERLALVYLNHKIYEKARECFLKVFKLTNNPEYAYRIGLSFMLEEKYEKAVDFFTVSLDRSGDSDEIYENIGICYYHLKKYWEAIQYLEPLINKGVTKEMIFFVYGSSLMKVGRLNEAREILEKGLKQNPSEINILYGLGLLEANRENYEKAARYLEKAVIIDRNPEIIYTLALTKMKLQEADSAVELFEEYMLQKQPEPEVLYKIGLLYIQLKEFDKARRVFQDIVVLNPAHEGAKNYIKDLEKL